MPNLVLLLGLPGAGKSTWAKSYFDRKYAIVSSDAIREQLAGSLREAHEAQVKPWDVFYQRIEDCLHHDVDVIADATFLTERHRTRARDLAGRTGASLHLVLFANWWQAEQRNTGRPEATRVPERAMADFTRLFFDSLAQVPHESYDSVLRIARFD